MVHVKTVRWKQMKKSKKIILSMLLVVSLMILMGCGIINGSAVYKVKIVTTQFPQYQFVKSIISDNQQLNNKFEVSLLVPPGADSHSFDLRVNDLIEIKNSNLFLYTSDEIEKWVKKLDINKYTRVIDLSEGIEMLEVDEEEHEHHHESHTHEFDPHYWLYPLNAIKMVEKIRDVMIELVEDTFCQNQIMENASSCINELQKVDQDIRKVVNNATTKKIYFGSPFSFYYWTHYYELEYVLTYATCSVEVDPSMTTIIDVINEMKEENIKVIYIKELLSDSVAEMISEATGAEIVLLHSCHNVSKTDYDNNKTYIEIMNDNVKALAKGLNVDYEKAVGGQ